MHPRLRVDTWTFKQCRRSVRNHLDSIRAHLNRAYTPALPWTREESNLHTEVRALQAPGHTTLPSVSAICLPAADQKTDKVARASRQNGNGPVLPCTRRDSNPYRQRPQRCASTLGPRVQARLLAGTTPERRRAGSGPTREQTVCAGPSSRSTQCAREDSNLQPSPPEDDASSLGLRAQAIQAINGAKEAQCTARLRRALYLYRSGSSRT